MRELIANDYIIYIIVFVLCLVVPLIFILQFVKIRNLSDTIKKQRELIKKNDVYIKRVGKGIRKDDEFLAATEKDVSAICEREINSKMMESKTVEEYMDLLKKEYEGKL